MRRVTITGLLAVSGLILGCADESPNGPSVQGPAFQSSDAPGEAAWLSVDAGFGHTCGLKSGGAVYCWGDNSQGQLGDGTTTSRSARLAVSGGLFFALVSAGLTHTCGLTSAGVAYCWGGNAFGELGDGTTTSRTAPVAVSGELSFASVSAGGSHTCGVTAGGVAYCWGANFNGALGDGTATHRTAPVAVSGGLSFASVSAGGGHTCGVTTGGAAYCWGQNLDGELGNGTTFPRTNTTPVAVSGGLAFASVSAGDPHTGGHHTCGVTTGGVAYCWGENFHGELGDFTTTDRAAPVAVFPPAPPGQSFASVSAGGGHTCGVTTGGAAYCWGNNFFGQVGNGETPPGADAIRPSAVKGGLSFASVSAGGDHTCGVTTGGAAYCWGDNLRGQLGDGTRVRRSTPVQVVFDLDPPSLDAGPDLTVEATSPSGAVVAYSAPLAIDAVDPSPVVSCSHSSGTVFPLGATTVTCTATDAAGNSTTDSFMVLVRDTTAPSLTVPANMTVNATSPSGAVVSYTVSASDIVSVPSVSCTPASGSLFAIGTHTVSCTATDAAGNSTTASFVVTVKGAEDQITDFKGIVTGLNLHEGTETSLEQKLAAALSALANGERDAACALLQALINQVNAQIGNKITAADGAVLIAEAERIRAVLGC